jgi:DNA polymerase III subunit epsilon
VAEDAQEAECAYLCESIYGRHVEPVMRWFTAHERISIWSWRASQPGS